MYTYENKISRVKVLKIFELFVLISLYADCLSIKNKKGP